MLKVEGHPGFERDTSSSVVVNTNSTGYEAYIQRRDAARSQAKETETLREEVSELKTLLYKTLGIN
ncbi:hypothetical protein MYOV003v1_p0131 [Vibrio phage 207E48.1]|nr:hypothetical protein MYOV003v1_p0131 [Vibrio phage 207E48.1]